MKEITSKKSGHVQIIDEETWQDIIARGWKNKFTMVDIPERKYTVPVIKVIPPEIKTKTKKNG